MDNASVASEFAGHKRPPVPRKQGPWVGYVANCCRVPNLLRRIAQQLSGEAVSVTLEELIVKDF
jgi:hypothetical protein